MGKFLLGVDGGNTKTDYLLCTLEGTQIDLLRTGTCSHENVGFDGMEQTMRAQLGEILSRNKLQIADIAAAGFGLAGADLPWQVSELENRIKKIGFTRFAVANDGILGIKAACKNGYGLCAVNGTGAVIIGADETGKILQVGGMGRLSGDGAGGSYIRDKIISRLYDFHFRCGENSTMFTQVLELLNAKPRDLLAIIADYDLLHRNMTALIQLAGSAAESGDAVAGQIFTQVGESVGKSAAGCIRNLSFTAGATPQSPLEVVLVGSIWHKVPYPGMIHAFAKTTETLTGKHIRTVKLEAPPAMGGVKWAGEMLARE